MARWKAAGSARRSDDDALWARFRAIQDQFFDSRTTAQSAVDGEQSENLAAKTSLVEQVEKDLDGVTDVERAKSTHREFLSKFNELGQDLDGRVKALGDKISTMEADEWRRTDPEARKRAEDTVALFQAQVDKLNRDIAAAEAKGDERKARDTAKSLETYNAWLNQASATLKEFQQA